MFATYVKNTDLPLEIVQSALRHALDTSTSLVLALALESRDLSLETLREALLSSVVEKLETWQHESETNTSDALVEEASQKALVHCEAQILSIQQRAEVVAENLQALEMEWQYLEHHSALHESRKHDILLHLSCSGQIEDRYEIFEQIDKGGQTQIVRARCKKTGEFRALKLLSVRSRSALLPRFLIEGSVGKSQLRDERLVRIFDFGGFFEPEHHTGKYYIACELLEGVTLRQWIQQNPYQARATDPHLHLLQQMVESLQYLHSQGFIHCDVNPFNFFVTNKDDIKLLDFGIIESIREIQLLSASQAISATQSVGGPTYQAPEQIDSLFGRPTPKTDVYALGVTLFEVFSGKLPFGSPLQGEALPQFAPIQSLPTRPRDLTQAAMPAWLDALIVRCLEKDPKSRPSLDELGFVIEHLVSFKVDKVQMKPLVEKLCRTGFDPERTLQEKITAVRSQFLAKLSPEEMRFVPMERLERAEDHVVERVHEQIHVNQNQLQALVARMEPWDPLLQTCPNLLCRADYQRGKRECPVCHTSWTISCDVSGGGHHNSYFTEHCQEPGCDILFDRTFKIETAYRKTLDIAVQQERCAEAAIVLLLLGEHLESAGETVNFTKFYEACKKELIPDRMAEQTAIFDQMRQEWERLVQEAKQGFSNLHPQVRQSLLLEARLLCDEERLQDALQLLLKFPSQSNDQEVIALRNELHEKLTASELQEASQRLESYQHRLQQMTVKLEELTPVEERHPGSNSISGWLAGVNDPLTAGEKGLVDAAASINSVEELLHSSESLLKQSEQPLENALKPIERAEEELNEVQESILELKEAFNKNQLKDVEGKLVYAQTVLNTSEEVLGEMDGVLRTLQEDLDRVRVNVGRGRGVLEEAEVPFEDILAALRDAGHHFTMLDSSSKQAQPQLHSMQQERKELQEQIQTVATLLQEVSFPSLQQDLLLRQVAEQEEHLHENGTMLKSREKQHEKLVGEARSLSYQMQKMEEQHRDERKRQEWLLQQALSVQKNESRLRKELERGQHQIQKEQKQIKQLREACAEWSQLEQTRRARVLHTAMTWAAVGALLGIVGGLLVGWWLFARNINLQKPGWFVAILWGSGMGLVMTFFTTFALGRKVFQQPGLVVLSGTIAGGVISLILHLMGLVVVGAAAGVFFGATIGWAVGGGLGALWNVRKLKPWRTLEESIKSARFGALFGVFAGASFGSNIGYARLLQASSFTWVFLTLGCVSLLALFGVTAGYFVAGGAWTDLKIAAEVDSVNRGSRI